MNSSKPDSKVLLEGSPEGAVSEGEQGLSVMVGDELSVAMDGVDSSLDEQPSKSKFVLRLLLSCEPSSESAPMSDLRGVGLSALRMPGLGFR